MTDMTLNRLTLRAARKRLKLSQAELGELLGVCARVVSNIEAGKRKLTLPEETILDQYFRERSLNLDQLQGPIQTEKRILVRVVVEKSFGAIDAETMTEIVRLIEAAKGLSESWTVSCKL
ncbi:MAG: helix-turn-helix transcriptional regulator [Candidatus Doudnabacteria bacterium]|nr:helix-turn-helix transcriptional regulator [Candidatus Doudnabacteria bacterium]